MSDKGTSQAGRTLLGVRPFTGVLAVAALAIAAFFYVDQVHRSADGLWTARYAARGGPAFVRMIIRDRAGELDGTASMSMADTIAVAFDLEGFRNGDEVSLRLLPASQSSNMSGRFQGVFLEANSIGGELFTDGGASANFVLTRETAR